MPTDRKQFKHESLENAGSLVNILRAVADGLATGTLSLRAGTQELRLAPRGLLRFKVEARQTAHRSRLALRVSWREDTDETGQAAPTLEISTRDA